MIQFNLLPDVKLEYISTRRTKRMVTVIATLVGAGSLAIMIMLFMVVNVLQAGHLKNLSEDIAADSQKLEEIQDLDKILTVQNQLNSLSSLHAKKPLTSRLSTYLAQLTPAQASISQLDIDFVASTVIVNGQADSLATVNTFADTLKFTKFKYDETEGQAFSDVVLTNFGIQEGKTNYLINFKYDPVIFDVSKNVELVVPNIVTTRSAIEKPEALFQSVETPTGDQ